MRLLSIFIAGVTVVALGLLAFDRTAQASDISAPPALAEDGKYLSNVLSVTIDGTPAQVRAFLNTNPITDYLEPTDRIPAIASIEGITGAWGTPGAVRRVILETGDSITERVISNTDTAFTYQIWEITAPQGRFIDHIKGEFLFDAVPEGTKITWSYNIKPRVFVARPFIQSFLSDDFAPFMKGGMEEFAAAYRAQ